MCPRLRPIYNVRPRLIRRQIQVRFFFNDLLNVFKIYLPYIRWFESSILIGYLVRVDYIFVVKIFLLKNYSTFSFLLDIKEHRDKIYSKELFCQIAPIQPVFRIYLVENIDFWLSMIFA